ncbi:MAG: hypothetical protein ACE5KM_06575 [Planctomycetaceae bacterium]
MLHAALLTALLGAPTATSVRSQPLSRAVEVFRFSFESDQDRDFDHQPDDWTRRKGPQFPTYVRSKIDEKTGRHGRQSLRFDVNGGRVIIYSPLRRVDSLHAFMFEGYIKTQGLKRDAALISLSFLNHRRQRVQRILSRPVTGTHDDWVRVRIGPVFPQDDVVFVVVGCHLVPGQGTMDLSGHVWFDNLWLGRLPQLTLASRYETHFRKPGSDVEISAYVGGLDTEAKYRLRMQMFDSSDQLVGEEEWPLNARKTSADTAGDRQTRKPLPISWSHPPQPRGFYRVRAILFRNGEAIIEKRSAFIVMDHVDVGREGEFGWTVSSGTATMPPAEIAEVATQSGINWLKYPLWQTVAQDRPHPAADVIHLFDVLTHRRITPVGLLNEPPASVRRKFVSSGNGVSEIFSMPPRLWWPAVEPVIARFSSTVRHWQVGGEQDFSLSKLKTVPRTLRNMKTEFDKIGRDTRIGLSWDWRSPLPKRMSHSFLSLKADTNRPTPEELMRLLDQSRLAGLQRWVVIEPLPKSKTNSPVKRAGNLVKQMVAAKAGRADAVFARNIFDPQTGLLQPNGAPTAMYLPWRTTALALRGSRFLGSLNLPGGTRNFAFANAGRGILVLWNDEAITEEVYLGPERDISVMDIWGRPLAVNVQRGTQRHVIPVGPAPVIVTGCTEALLRWRLAVRFQVAQLESRRGGQPQAVLGKNTFDQGVTGTAKLNVPRGWSLQPSTWQLRVAKGGSLSLPTTITVPANASLGDVPVTIDFNITGDRPYSFRIHRTFKVGMGDVAMQIFDRKTKNGRLEIQQIITNNTQPVEELSFRCSLFVPGYRRQRRTVTQLRKGRDRKFYVLPDAESLRGKTLWIRAEQIEGDRVLNFRWKALENEDLEADPGQPKSTAKTPAKKAVPPKKRPIP